MARAAYSTKLDTILAGDDASFERRLLAVDPAWPDDGDPANDAPFAYGDQVEVPAVPDPVTAYDPSTYDSTVWTDVSVLVGADSIHYTQAANAACAELTFTTAEGWEESDLAEVFREGRVLLYQERWRGSGQDTDWFGVAWCLSDGYNEAWEAVHGYSVRARDAASLAGLHKLGRASGVEVYKADLIQEGTPASHLQLTMIHEAADAWEYAVVDRDGDPQPNWSPHPAPQFWCHDFANPVNLAVGGDGVQAVFGDGIVRVSKAWAAASPGAAGEEDYSAGLGIVGAPDIRGIVWRYAHAAQECYNPAGTSPAPEAATDLVESTAIVVSGAGYVEIAGDYTAWPDGLTLVLTDGSGERYATTGLALSGANTRITLADSTVTLATTRTVRYGEANRARDVAVRMLLSCGYQTAESADALYAESSSPTIGGATKDIVLPPLTFRDDDQRSPMEALEDLRTQGWVPPNWVLHADADGRVAVESVEQLSAGHADIIPVTRVRQPAVVMRQDQQVYTDVIARGIVRQVTDACRLPSAATVTNISTLPTPAAPGCTTVAPTSTLLNNLVAQRPSYGAYPHNYRLFGWQGGGVNCDGREMETWVSQWLGVPLIQIDLAESKEIHALELDLSNPWTWAWGEGRPLEDPLVPTTENWFYALISDQHQFRPATFRPQAWKVEYYDATSAAWLPLCSYVKGSASAFPDIQRIEYGEFDDKAPVTTAKLRFSCAEPNVIEWGRQTGWGPYHVLISMFLSGVRAWESAETRGVAVLGQTSPFNTAAWQAVRARLRPRTFVLPEPAPWAQSVQEATYLAVLWLQEFARDMAPRQLTVVRPDVRLYDTISATLPGGSSKEYFVVGTGRSVPGEVTVTAVDYSDPYG